METNTAHRLRSYYSFDEATIAAVSNAAEWQNKLTFHEIADTYNMANGPQKKHRKGMIGALEYLQFTPTTDHDPQDVRVMMTPMSTPADQNMAMHAARFFAADPTKELYVFGAPAYIGRGTNKLALKNMKSVWSGDLSPVAAPVIEFLEEKNIESISLFGYSYAASVIAALGKVAHTHNMSVDKSVAIEPVALSHQSVFSLLNNFSRSADQLEAYVSASQSVPFLEARAMSDVGFVRYAGGLVRLSNIAIAHSLAQPTFFRDIHEALDTQPGMYATQFWGGLSELVPTETIMQSSAQLALDFPGRTEAINIPSMHHAGSDDIDLYAAMLLHGIK